LVENTRNSLRQQGVDVDASVEQAAAQLKMTTPRECKGAARCLVTLLNALQLDGLLTLSMSRVGAERAFALEWISVQGPHGTLGPIVFSSEGPTLPAWMNLMGQASQLPERLLQRKLEEKTAEANQVIPVAAPPTHPSLRAKAAAVGAGATAVLALVLFVSSAVVYGMVTGSADSRDGLEMVRLSQLRGSEAQATVGVSNALLVSGILSGLVGVGLLGATVAWW
jgi:hypothetical protein